MLREDRAESSAGDRGSGKHSQHWCQSSERKREQSCSGKLEARPGGGGGRWPPPGRNTAGPGLGKEARGGDSGCSRSQATDSLAGGAVGLDSDVQK